MWHLALLRKLSQKYLSLSQRHLMRKQSCLQGGQSHYDIDLDVCYEAIFIG